MLKKSWLLLLLIVLMSLLTTQIAIADVDSQPEPYFSVIPNFQQVGGHHWPLGATLELEIHGPGVDFGPVSAEVVRADDDPGSETWVEFNLIDFHPNPVELVQPGFIYTLTNPNTEVSKEHTVKPLFVNSVNPTTNTIGGTAEPGSQVRVDPNPSDDDTSVTVTANSDGFWSATNPEWEIYPYFGGDATQWDEDGDSTQFQIRLPLVSASLVNNSINFEDFNHNTAVSIEVFRDGQQIFDDSRPTEKDSEGHAWLDGGEADLDLEVGDLIIATDQFSNLTKTLILENLTLHSFDIEADYIAGTGPAEAWITANVGNKFSGIEEKIQIDADGDWELYTSPFDITEDMDTQAFLPDEDFDNTVTEFVEPQLPLFTIEPEHKWAHGEFWPIGVPITLTIDDDTDPSNGFIYQDTHESYESTDNPEGGAVDFDPIEVEDLDRGLYVTMTDGQIIKDTWIADLYYDYLDVGLDIAVGHGPGGNYGFMVASYGEGFFMNLPEIAPGEWIADFGSAGHNATNVPDTFILRRDEDGDETMIHLPQPLFIEGNVPFEPIEIGTPVPVWATFESFLFNGPIDPLLNISFCIDDPEECFGTDGPTPNWVPATSLADESPNTAGMLEVVFGEPGVYPAFAHAFNPDGPESFAFLGLIVVYDPAGGFVTGGGWIESTVGAYISDPELTGKATFGFVSKYKKGANVPSGNTEFHFNAGNLNFHSSDYDWLVVTGNDYARFKGTGTVNGEGEYKFMIWAGDNDPDTFRIKIWEEDDLGVETVVYDNEFDQNIDGGSIIVHSK